MLMRFLLTFRRIGASSASAVIAVLQFRFALARHRDVPEGRVSVTLLVLVVPAVEVDVEHDDGTGGEACQEVLLIVRQCQRPDAAVARWERVQWCQIEGAPHLDDALVAGRHQIFAVAGQEHTLQIIVVRLVPQQLSVDGVRRHVALVIVYHDEALPRQGYVLRRDEILGRFQ